MVRIPLRKLNSLQNFGNSVYAALPVSFGEDTKIRLSLLSGVYARGSKRSHQSALEMCKCHGLLHPRLLTPFAYCPVRGPVNYKTRQDKTIQDITIQYKTRQDKTRQDKTRQDKTRQDQTRPDQTRPDQTRPDQTRRDETRRDETILQCILQLLFHTFAVDSCNANYDWPNEEYP